MPALQSCDQKGLVLNIPSSRPAGRSTSEQLDRNGDSFASAIDLKVHGIADLLFIQQSIQIVEVVQLLALGGDEDITDRAVRQDTLETRAFCRSASLCLINKQAALDRNAITTLFEFGDGWQ